MFNFRNISIRNKLVVTTVTVTLIVLGLCFGAFVTVDVRGYKERKISSASAIAQVTSSTSSSALQFLDNASAKKILSDLAVENDLTNAVILDKKGAVFASYTRPGYDSTFTFTPHAAAGTQYEYTRNYLFIYNRIVKDNEALGVVCLRFDLAPLNQIIRQEFAIAVFLLVIGIGLAFLITLFIQGFITKPLLNLVSLMQSIIGSGDYKKRADVVGNDEITKLSQAFNNMLEQIERRDNEMEMRVKERTAELEAANKELESFSYSVSHDMRAPLRAVSGFANIINKKYMDRLDKDGQEALQIISNEASRMGQLIDDLLAFSRLGKSEISKFKMDMNAIVESAMKEVVNSETRKHNAEIVLDKLPASNGDNVLIRQVFINLFSNALKYSDHVNAPKIHVGGYNENGKHIYYVEDNGAGFDMKFYHKLFGVFQRLHTQPQFKGTGIGLAIVQKIITKHGGTVWATSELDKGSTFFFSLPE